MDVSDETVVVSNMVWVPRQAIRDVDWFLLRKNLTIVPIASDYSGEPPKPIHTWRQNDEWIGLPRSYFRVFLTDKFKNKILKLADGQPLQAFRPTALRPEDQEPVAKRVMEYLRAHPFAGGIVKAPTGWGKTTVSIEIARRVGRTTLVLVHKKPLMEQWVERIQQFCPGARIGIIQGPRCEYQNVDFSIGMIQSMMNERGEKYPTAMFSAFGLILVDEVHTTGAHSFSTVVPQFSARHIIGLSGTPRRADGCADVFKYYIGDVIGSPPVSRKIQPTVWVMETGMRAIRKSRVDQYGQSREFDLNDGYKKPAIVTELTKNQHRNSLIAKHLVQAVRAGRRPLVMSERLDVFDTLRLMLNQICDEAKMPRITQGLYIGGKKKEELDAAAKCTVLYATLQLAKEGIDIKELDTLFLVTPLSDPVQLIGRIGRAQTVINADGTSSLVPIGKPPMVMDYVDTDIGLCKGLYFSRWKHYLSLGCEIVGHEKI